MPLMIDPGLYENKKSDIFWVQPNRPLPSAFKLFTGSAWMVLLRPFVEYCIWGWDNLRRTLLMYYTNFVSSPEGYFQTVICNVPEFIPTVINHDMHFISWDNPPKQYPHVVNINDTSKMIDSGAAFACKFNQDIPVLDRIDDELLNRPNGSFTPGGWCKANCTKVGKPTRLKPGRGLQLKREKCYLVLKNEQPLAFPEVEGENIWLLLASSTDRNVQPLLSALQNRGNTFFSSLSCVDTFGSFALMNCHGSSWISDIKRYNQNCMSLYTDVC